MNKKAIGIIDSGVGGLSIYQAIRERYPNTSIIYLADSKNIPYGTKSPEFITTRALELVAFLSQQGVTLIVIACNTITVTCLDALRQAFPHITFIGTVPSIKTASEKTRSKHIGILSTIRTAESEYVDNLVKEYATDCVVTSLGTDALVPLVEKGEIEGESVTELLTHVLSPFITAGCDTIVLGCTHFPFLKAEMQRVLGADVLLLDSADAIARQVGVVLEGDLIAEPPTILFYTTGVLKQFAEVTRILLSQSIPETSFLQAQI